jgi:plastocyanin
LLRSSPLFSLAAAAVTLLAVPIGAHAATTKSVDMGLPLKVQKTFNQKYQSDVNAYFPSSISIHVGEAVKFVPTGFHNVDLPARGGQPGSLVAPTGQKANATDAAGAPYWFNGQDNFSFSPTLLKGLFGKSVSYDSTKPIQSGLPLAAKPKPFTVTFKKAGTFTYFCAVHPGMKGTVRVVPKGKAVPSAKADAKAVAAQVAAAEKNAKALAKTTPPTGVVTIGAAGPHGVEDFSFFPSKVTIPTGTTLRFEMSKSSFEAHTATTGPGDPQKPDTFLGKMAATLESPTIDPALIYPSDAPPATASLTPTSHGNGFWNSGFLDTASASPPPSSAAVKFDAPGTYEFYCIIHPFMHATVTVQ